MAEVDWPEELALIGLGEAMAFRKMAGDHPLLGEIVDILRTNDRFLVPVKSLLIDLRLAQAIAASSGATELETSRAATFGGTPDDQGEPIR